jgi:hypothetical protein
VLWIKDLSSLWSLSLKIETIPWAGGQVRDGDLTFVQLQTGGGSEPRRRGRLTKLMTGVVGFWRCRSARTDEPQEATRQQYDEQRNSNTLDVDPTQATRPEQGEGLKTQGA